MHTMEEKLKFSHKPTNKFQSMNHLLMIITKKLRKPKNKTQVENIQMITSERMKGFIIFMMIIKFLHYYNNTEL